MEIVRVFGLITFALCFTICNSIFEDQIDKFDWTKENVGVVQQVQFPKENLEEFYASTHKNIIAKMATSTGKIAWRHVLGEDESVQALVLVSSGLFSLSKDGKASRMWSKTNGSVIWDSSLHTHYTGIDRDADAIGFQDSSIIVLSNNQIVCLDAKTGKMLWKFTPESIGKDLTIRQIAGGEKLIALASSTKGTVHGIVLSPTSGTPEIHHEFPVAYEKVVLIRHPEIPLISFISENREKIGLFEVVSGKERVLDLPDGYTAFSILDKKLSSALVVKTEMDYLVYSPSSGKLVVSITLQKEEVVTINDAINVHGYLVIGVSYPFNPLHVEIWDMVKEKKASSDSSFMISHEAYGNLQSIYPHVYIPTTTTTTNNKQQTTTEKQEELKIEYFCVMEDDAFVLMKDNKVSWLREESLASIEQAEWVTPSDVDSELPSSIPSFLDTLKLQLFHFKHMLLQKHSFSDLFGSDQHQKSYFFGFTKLIIVRTTSGKLMAIHSESGDISWSKFFRNSNCKLIITRDHPALGAGPEVLVISSTQFQDGSNAIWMDADNGELIEKKPFFQSKEQSKIQHVFLLKPHQSSGNVSGRSVVVLVDKDLGINLVPDTQESKETLRHQSSSLCFHVYNKETPSFHGYKILPHHSLHQAVEVWSLVLSPSEKVIQIASTPSKQQIDSPAVITGDDSLLLKYINPHMFTIASIETTTTTTTTTTTATTTLQTLYITLIDSITGRIIHRISHKHGDLPVNVVQTMNNVVYTFWNANKLRTELGSLALYEGAIHSHGLNLWKSPPLSKQFSSFSSKLPIVLQKSFIFPTHVKALAPTLTAQGITPTHILVGLSSGQIYSLPSQWIDPRRPEEKPSLEQQSEGLIQYIPHLSVQSNPLGMVSYNKTIANLKEIKTFPASLESTCLTFAYGIDMFYVRVTPAAPFDLLASDFNYELLILLVIGLISAALVLKNLAERKELSNAWK